MKAMRFPRLIRKPAVRLLAHVPSSCGPIRPGDRRQFARDVRNRLGDPPVADDVDGDGRRDQPTTRPSGGRPRGARDASPDVSFDHSVIDGAPAARFATTFRKLLESAAVLDDLGSGTQGERSATVRPAGRQESRGLVSQRGVQEGG